MLSLAHTTAPLLAAASIALSALFGPPHITVRPVTDASAAPAGAVLLIETMHHTAPEDAQVVAHAEGIVNGKRTSLPLQVARQSLGHYSLTKQWTPGMPWLLVLTIEQGKGGSHGVAEALVKVDASGAIASIEYPAAGWIANTDTPKRTSAQQIDALVATMAVRR